MLSEKAYRTKTLRGQIYDNEDESRPRLLPHSTRDGVDFDPILPLHELHDNEPYHLAMFLTGAVGLVTDLHNQGFSHHVNGWNPPWKWLGTRV